MTTFPQIKWQKQKRMSGYGRWRYQGVAGDIIGPCDAVGRSWEVDRVSTGVGMNSLPNIGTSVNSMHVGDSLTDTLRKKTPGKGSSVG